MSSKLRRIYWDACAFLGYMNREEDKFAALEQIWAKALGGELEIWTSTYSFIEVIYGKNLFGEPYPAAENDAIVYDLLEQPHIERVQMDTEIAKLARSLKREHHQIMRKRSDSIHLATAVYWNCEELHTYDGSDLLPLDEIVTRKDGLPLKILAPKYEADENSRQAHLFVDP